jgi:hypothetical protein
VPTAVKVNADLELAKALADYYADPLGHVLFSYPWGKGTLEGYDGPDTWQAEFLEDVGRQVRERGFDGKTPVAPIRMATASGHGIGKTVLSAWLYWWIKSTRPHSQITVTANTFPQLQTKTWAAIRHWGSLAIFHHWFEIGGQRAYHKNYPSTWFGSAQTCREENSEAFAGQHAATSSSVYLFDEASAVPDKIFEVAEGGLTDGEPMEFLFGNPTRSSGKFYRVTFGSERERWVTRSIDSRSCKFTNKAQIAEWIQDYGEDSDFVRVRILGLPPSASELQFIDNERIYAAQKRVVNPLPDEPLVAGFDVSGGGSAWNVIRFRRGQDGANVPAPIRITGQKGRDRAVLIGVCAELLRDQRPEHKLAAMFVDSAFGSPIVERLQTLGFRNVHEVNFGGHSPDIHQANMRAYMWNKAKDWLLKGALPTSKIPNDDADKLAWQLALPGHHPNQSNKLVIESKMSITTRGEASPDDADAFCLTFAQAVAVPIPKYSQPPTRLSVWS